MKKIDYKLISLVATAGLIFSQLALPVAQVASMTEHVETHQNPSGQRASPSSADLAPKEPEKARSSPTVVSTKQTGDITVTLDAEKSAEGFEKATASLASLETSDATKRNDQDLDKLSQELKKDALKITDAQIIDLTNLPISENLGVTLTFKEGLALAGLTEKDKNLKIGILTSESDEVSVVDATKVTLMDKEEGQAQKVTKLSYKGKITQPSTRIIIARTTKLQEKTELDLEDYGKLLLDGTTEQEKTDQLSPYRKPVTIKVFVAKTEVLEGLPNFNDFEEVLVKKQLYGWEKEFVVLEYTSENYDVIKTEYKEASANEFQVRELLLGEYESNSSLLDTANTINIYLHPKTSPLKASNRSIDGSFEPRAYRSIRQKSNKTEKVLPHEKRIDYLGDKENNPDTTVDNSEDIDNSDLYRLYLDMTGTKQPLDILVVVDRSWSMNEPIGDNESTRRDEAVKDALTGSNGLLKKFSEIDPQNRVAVIGFQGETSLTYDRQHIDWVWWGNEWRPRYQPHVSSNRDAEILKNWDYSLNLNRSDLSARYNNGTNYHAALLKATEMFKKVAKDENRRKIMVFVSDGVPTFYFGSDQYRAGNGSSKDSENVERSRQITESEIKEFQKNNPDVSTYSLGVSKNINGEGISSNPRVLKSLSGEEHYFSITNTKELETALDNIVQASKISHLEILDTLSENVSFYKDQPDILVTRKRKSDKLGNNVETLYTKGSLTPEGVKILSDIEIPTEDKQPQKVTLKFQPNHKIDDEYTYTLSFNVKASDKAYENYKNQEGKYLVNGDPDTDYPDNDTSSKKGGLKSNDTASVNYTADARQHNLPYKDPVIQVHTIPMTIEKVDAKDPNTKLDGVKFTLYRENDKEKEKVWEEGTTTENGQLTFKYLQKGKTYSLYEKKAKPGYALPQEPWTVKVDRDGTVTVTDQKGEKVDVKEPKKQPVDKNKGETFVLKNHKINLPTTGGPGTYAYLMIGMTVATVSLGAYSYRKKKA